MSEGKGWNRLDPSRPEKSRRRVSVDFDGVLHSYKTPWIAPHVIPDPPNHGAIGWLSRMVQDFDVVIHTTRARTWRGRRAVRAWLKKESGSIWYPSPGYNGIEDVVVSYKKLASIIYIDDRGWRFDGSFPTKDEIMKAKPWFKK